MSRCGLFTRAGFTHSASGKIIFGCLIDLADSPSVKSKEICLPNYRLANLHDFRILPEVVAKCRIGEEASNQTNGQIYSKCLIEPELLARVQPRLYLVSSVSRSSATLVNPQVKKSPRDLRGAKLEGKRLASRI